MISSFEVNGPGPTATLTLQSTASTSMISGAGSSEAEAFVNLNGGTPLAQEYACANSGMYACQLSSVPCCSATGSFPTPNPTFTVSTGVHYTELVELFFYVVNQTTLSGTIDPDITFAPGFDSSGYSLIYSSNAPSEVPLPAAAWLILSGLGGMSLLARRRKMMA
jgi:hypothetical protein